MRTYSNSSAKSTLSAYPADRSEAVLRILKGRSTLDEEAERMNVDEATVATWVSKTLTALADALASTSKRSSG
jgi:DNA-directed RNA polymerase specialized sigma24 family protein